MADEVAGKTLVVYCLNDYLYTKNKDMMNLNVLLIGMPGGWEWIIIVLVIILLFGAKKIPELARGLGRGIREFKDATKQVKDEIKEGEKETEEKKSDK